MSNFRDIGFDGHTLDYVGKQRGNSKNWSDNYMKLASDSDVDVAPTLDVVVIDSAADDTITSIILGGKTTPGLSVACNDEGAVLSAIRDHLATLDVEIVNPILSAKFDSVADTLTVFYVATNTLTSLTATTDGVKASTEYATQMLECQYQFDFDVTDTDVAVAGPSSTESWNASVSTDTSFDTALTTAGVTSYDNSSAQKSGNTHTMTVYVEGTSPGFTIDGAAPTLIKCQLNFK